jgi:hypothetical protein
MSDEVIYSKPVQTQLDKLEKELDSLKFKSREINRKIEQVKIGACPIKVGDIIEWESVGKLRRGRVVIVKSAWSHTFEFRVNILTKRGKAIGFANVTEKHHAVLETQSIVTK